MSGIYKPDKGTKAEFDDALRRLEAAEARVQALSANPSTDELTLQNALEAYQEARLLWLSSEAVLRSAAIVEEQPRHSGKSVVIVQGNNAHVGESIALLLRLRGFRTTLLSKHRLDDATPHGPIAAIIVDIERNFDKARVHAIKSLKTDSRARIIGMIPQSLEYADWQGFDTVLVKPASIDTIVQAIVFDAGAQSRLE